MIYNHTTAEELENEFLNRIYREVYNANPELPFHRYLENAGDAIKGCYRAIEATEFTRITKTEALKALDGAVAKMYEHTRP